MLDKTWKEKDKKLKKIRTRKAVSSFSAEPAYLNLLNYLAKKFKVCRGKFLRLAIADFAHRYITAQELDTKPLVRKWYSEVIERELWGNKRLRVIKKGVTKEENEILKGVKVKLNKEVEIVQP